MRLILAVLLLTLSACSVTHTTRLPDGTQMTQECTRYYVPWYAVVAFGVFTFETSCHVIEPPKTI